jgi:EmrB/QacA subfamily drug resistance transporter
MESVDANVIVTALPSMARDFGRDPVTLKIAVTSYVLGLGVFIPVCGWLADRFGARTVFRTAIGVFVAGSLLCAASSSLATFTFARFVQGIGGAMTSAVILGMIVTMFPQTHERAKAISTYSFVASAGGALGLLLGGVITQGINWHWIFFVNLPIGIATAFFALRLLPDDRGIGLRRGADAPGALLLVSSLMLAVYSIVEASHYGWGSAHTLGFGAVALSLLAGFIARQMTAANPLMPLRIFSSRTVTGANLVQVLMVAGLFGMFFLGALYMQRVLGYDAIQVGLAFLPVALGIAVMSLGFAARLMERFGPKQTLVPGLVLVAIGLLLFRSVPLHASYVSDLLPTMVLFGVGAGMAFPSLMTLAMSAATPEDSGLASGLVNTTQQVGGALGLAVLATLSANRASTLSHDGGSLASSLVGGYHLAFTVGAVLVVVAVVLAATLLRTVQPQAEEVVRLPEAIELEEAA